jgi:spore germination cell wall hydrolase CwlJ-like protein
MKYLMLFLSCCKIIAADHTVALTILAEARGEGERGMAAVACVIRQRAEERNLSLKQVCLQKWQFSCWNGKQVSDLNHLLKEPQAEYALWLEANMDKLKPEALGNANHYHATWMKKLPYWAKGKNPVKIVGQHAFYRL